MIDNSVWHSTLSLPPELESWFLDPSSMTKRMNLAGKQPLEVNLLQQNWQQPLESESQRLQLPLHEPTLLREVELLSGGEIWIYARTIIPKGSLEGKLSCLNDLGTRPLGEILFSFPELMRSPFEVAKLMPMHIEYQLATRHITDKPDHLWARRSIFSVDEQSLLLTEVFLPESICGLAA